MIYFKKARRKKIMVRFFFFFGIVRTEFERRAKLRFCFVWGLLVPVEWAVACTQKTRRE